MNATGWLGIAWLLLPGAAAPTTAPAEAPVGIALLPEVAWSRRIDLVPRGRGAADEDAYYVCAGPVPALARIELFDGKVRWRSPTIGPASGPPLPTGRHVLVAGRRGGLSARERTRGSIAWALNAPKYRVIGAPDRRGGNVCFAAEGGRIVACRERTGKVLWDVPLAGPAASAPADPHGICGTPVFADGGTRVLAADWSTLHLLDARTGRRLSSHTPHPSGRVHEVLAFAGRLYATFLTPGGAGLICCDRDLKPLWTFPSDRTPREHLPPFLLRQLAGQAPDRRSVGFQFPHGLLGAGSAVHFAFGRHLYALDAAGGRLRWATWLERPGGLERHLLASRHHVLLVRDGGVAAFHRDDGAVAWELRGDRAPRGAVVRGQWLYGCRPGPGGRWEFVCFQDDLRRALTALAAGRRQEETFDARVRRLIRALGDPKWATRRQAVRELIAAGPPAERYVLAIDSKDTEVLIRKEAVLAALAQAPTPPARWSVRLDAAALRRLMAVRGKGAGEKVAAVLAKALGDDFGFAKDPKAAAEKVEAEIRRRGALVVKILIEPPGAEARTRPVSP